MKALAFAALLLLSCVGCAYKTSMMTKNKDFEEVWLGALDTLSDTLIIDQVDKERGVIVAASDSRWLRTEVRVEVVRYRNQYSVLANVREVTLDVFLKPSGLRTGERENIVSDNPQAAERLVKAIVKRVGRPDPLPGWKALEPKEPAQPAPAAGKKAEAQKGPAAKAAPDPTKEAPKGKATKAAPEPKAQPQPAPAKTGPATKAGPTPPPAKTKPAAK